MRLAADKVVDWDGGTRIGDSVETFVKDWGRRGLSRGATVIICSDGLDRGSPAVLAEAMEKLERLSHRIVWMNPLHDAQGGVAAHAGNGGRRPSHRRDCLGQRSRKSRSFASRLAEIG